MFFNLLHALDILIQYYFVLLPIGSLFLFVVFAALRMWNCRVAWFLSLSAPGAIAFFVNIAGLLASGVDVVLLIVWLFAYIFVVPGVWIFAIVFAVQLRNLLQKRRYLMTRDSYVMAALLLTLYFWTDLALNAMRYKL